MPDKQISNPGGLYGLTADPNPISIDVVNNSGGTLLPGDLVCFTTDVTGVLATTTTTPSDTSVWGVVAAKVPSDSLNTQSATGPGLPYASGAVMPIIIKGPARINIAANTVAAGGNLSSSAVAKVAATAAAAGSVGALQGLVGSFIAIALESQAAKDANNTIRAYISKM
jgi:hypothetical protein